MQDNTCWERKNTGGGDYQIYKLFIMKEKNKEKISQSPNSGICQQKECTRTDSRE